MGQLRMKLNQKKRINLTDDDENTIIEEADGTYNDDFDNNNENEIEIARGNDSNQEHMEDFDEDIFDPFDPQTPLQKQHSFVHDIALPIDDSENERLLNEELPISHHLISNKHLQQCIDLPESPPMSSPSDVSAIAVPMIDSDIERS